MVLGVRNGFLSLFRLFSDIFLDTGPMLIILAVINLTVFVSFFLLGL